MKRREFIKNAAVGVTALADINCNGTGAQRINQEEGTHARESVGSGWDDGIGRPVRIVSIGFKEGTWPLEKIAKTVDEEGARRPDIISLPELERGQDQASEEPLHGPTVSAMSRLAKKHKTYIACPIDRRDSGRRYNSVVLLDRLGNVVCVYDKVFPYWGEYDVHPPVSPGDATRVYDADFGRVGFATCFDVNFPEVWRCLSDQGAEVVIWPSAYSAGISLQAHAINFHYYIVTCSQTPDCIAYDITGERILYHRGTHTSNISRITLDLDRCIFHENFNISKRDKLLREHPEDVEQEKWMQLEQWFVLRAKRPGVSARLLASQYGLEELRHYISRSRLAIDARRGWEFEERIVFPEKSIEGLKALASETEIAKLPRSKPA
jgi:predicted amidohydrolase